MPNPDFQVSSPTVSDDGANTILISISGLLDFTTAKSALTTVNEHLQTHSGPSIIDLAGVTSSNSAALALMIEWLAQAEQNNRELRFANIPDSLRQISTVCQVDSLI